MANGSGATKLGNFFQQYFTGIGAAIGLAQPYNPDAAMYQAQQAQAAVRIAQAEAEANAKRNQTILIAVGAFALVAILGGIGYAVFKD
jgi:hypothetical protein